MTCFLWGHLPTLGPTICGQKRIISSTNKVTGVVGSDFPRWIYMGKDGWLSYCTSFHLYPLGWHLYNAWRFCNTWLSLPRELDISDLHHQFTLQPLWPPYKAMTPWNSPRVFVLLGMCLSCLFCPMTSKIPFCLRMFCCLLLWTGHMIEFELPHIFLLGLFNKNHLKDKDEYNQNPWCHKVTHKPNTNCWAP